MAEKARRNVKVKTSMRGWPMITGLYGSQEPWVNGECVGDGWNWSMGKKKSEGTHRWKG